MNFRQLYFRKLGVVALVLLLAISVGVAIKKTSRQAEQSVSQTSAALNVSNESTDLISSGNDLNSDLIQTYQDTTKLAEILEQRDLLLLMDEWRGKALFVKLDTTRSPHVFHYYYYDAVYQDSNSNGVYDPADRGFFNPASTVKVAIAALALEKLSANGLTRQANYRMINTERWYSFEEDIRRALVISDNEATNRLMLWLGFDTIKNNLAEKDLSQLVINRLMLDEGTLIPSPAFEMRFEGEIIQQSEQAVSIDSNCYETSRKIGNCAVATDLLKSLMQINHPEYFMEGPSITLSSADREWLKAILSRTPREEGFDYADDYCRFLTEMENKFASDRGQMLSKCGVSLFSNTYTDLSYLETDDGEKYYILLSLSPTGRASETEIIRKMSQVADAVLSSDL